MPTRLPGAPRVTILKFQRFVKILGAEGIPVTEAADPNEAAEQLALVLASHGLQRMTARVLAALLFTEQPTMTMGELADRLQASSGAISGATKMLTSVGLAERAPAPASRRDHYRLRDDAWAVLFTNQNAVISAMLRRRRGRHRRHRRRHPGRASASSRCATSTTSCWRNPGTA